jgi:hypothetical protein
LYYLSLYSHSSSVFCILPFFSYMYVGDACQSSQNAQKMLSAPARDTAQFSA